MNQIVSKTNQTPIEIALGVDEYGRTTARKLYEFLELAKGQFSRWAKANIISNQFAEEGIDYKGFDINVEGNTIKDYKLTAAFAKKLSMTAKNEKGEQAREYFIRVEDGAKKLASKIQDLSPQLQVLINMELRQKQLQKEITEAKEQIATVKENIIADVEDWRGWINQRLKAIGTMLGDYKRPRAESYTELEKRARCNLDRRLNNKIENMKLAGSGKTIINNANYLDVINDDPRLKEIYTAIVKEMSIKYL